MPPGIILRGELYHRVRSMQDTAENTITPQPAPPAKKETVFSSRLQGLKSKNLFKVVFLIFLLFFVGFGVWYYLESQGSLPKPVTTNDWLIFRDEFIGYTISYPPEMISPKENCGSFILPADAKEREQVVEQQKSSTEIGLILKGLRLNICSLANPNNLSVEEFAAEYAKDRSFRPETIGKGRYPAVASIAIEGGDGLYFLTSPSGAMVSISFHDGSSETNPQFTAPVVPMLNSFEFTQTGADATNWKAYTSETGNYSVRYPPNWQIEQRTKDWGNFQGTYYTFIYERKVEFAPGIRIFVLPLTTPEEFLGKSLDYDGVTITTITLGGEQATFIDGIPGALLQRYYFINRNSQTIIIFTDTDSEEMESVASQILSTFNFNTNIGE